MNKYITDNINDVKEGVCNIYSNNDGLTKIFLSAVNNHSHPVIGNNKLHELANKLVNILNQE